MTVAPKMLVERFYNEVWNCANEAVAREILHKDLRFRASLGPERHGPEGFIGYLRAVRQALPDFICIIEELIETERKAVARMHFEGHHRGLFFGVEATGLKIIWAGAAFFKTDGEQITEIWVLGDIDSVKQQLGAAPSESFSSD